MLVKGSGKHLEFSCEALRLLGCGGGSNGDGTVGGGAWDGINGGRWGLWLFFIVTFI